MEPIERQTVEILPDRMCPSKFTALPHAVQLVALRDESVYDVSCVELDGVCFLPYSSSYSSG